MNISYIEDYLLRRLYLNGKKIYFRPRNSSKKEISNYLLQEMEIGIGESIVN